jgi:alpha-1,6-mannosyltransferase
VELAEWLASADALVHAGTKETFGLVVLEGMACGLPVVAARAGAFPEFIDETVGVLAEPMSPSSMAEAIASLYERDLTAIGAAARARVLRQFTWSRAFHAQLSIYASLFGLQRAPLSERAFLGLRSPSS